MPFTCSINHVPPNHPCLPSACHGMSRQHVCRSFSVPCLCLNSARKIKVEMADLNPDYRLELVLLSFCRQISCLI